MNFFPNIPMYDNTFNNINNIINKLNEYENRLKKLEQRISKLEGENNNNKNNYSMEPDNTMYML